MRASLSAARLIMNFEGFSAVPYPDGGGVMTIGYGHAILEGEEFDTITKEEAEQLLMKDIKTAADDVNRMVDVPLNQNQFDALVSFFYNVGAYQIEGSHTLGYINAGEFDRVPKALLSWNKDNGKVVKGLTRRRKLEGDLFATPV